MKAQKSNIVQPVNAIFVPITMQENINSMFMSVISILKIC